MYTTIGNVQNPQYITVEDKYGKEFIKYNLEVQVSYRVCSYEASEYNENGNL